LTGTIPATIARVKGLQILHLKENRLTGTIPSEFGDLLYLSWFDVSQNFLYGTIPSSFGQSVSLEDFRIVDNYIHGTIPSGLCENIPNLNGGDIEENRCHGVACPRGWYNSHGYATADFPCEKCPEGTTNLYMSSSFCDAISDEDILSIFFEVMDGRNWPTESQVNWSNHEVPVCEWGGIDCDELGEITSISFPVHSNNPDTFDFDA
jgi:hypothetical protein